MLKYWLLAIRPKTLSIAIVPVLVGSILGWLQSGALAWSVMLAAMLSATLIQAGTNLHNDALDFERGADQNTTRLGPARATAQGWLSSIQVRRGAMLSFALALLLGCYLIWVGGWPILLIGLISVTTGLAYTGGPRPIAYSGLGEFFVWLFFGLIAVTGSYYLQTHQFSWTALLVGALVGMPAAAVLVVNNYRDLDNDKLVGKNTLAVKMGRRVSRIEYALLMLLPFALLALLHPLGFGWLLPWLTLPWAIKLVQRFWQESPGPIFNDLLADTAKFQLGFCLLLAFGLVSSRLISS